MKTAIHPQWYGEAEISCACGNIIMVGSTKPKIRVEICSRCHPFFTGELKYVDTRKRVERFQTKAAKVQPGWTPMDKKAKLAKQKAQETDNQPRTLKEMLLDLKNQ